jgi:stage V sporulation protein R
MTDKFMYGAPILQGGATTPGVQIPKELKVLIPDILKACTDFGLDYYPTVVQMLTYDEMSEIASYGGFPVRYPHWKWGMEYEEMQRGYMYGMHKIYELVINCNPCYIYCLNSNTLLDNVTVIAHATGHNHYFKNNIYFKHTSQNMINELANHASRIRKYMQRWGVEKVTEFIDHLMRIETLIDPVKAWNVRQVKNPIVRDERKYRHPKRINIGKNREYMDSWINTTEYIHSQKANIDQREKAEELGIQEKPERDIYGWIMSNIPLKPWQADIMSMIYEEAMYFAPQGMTKVANEGLASWVDYNIIAKQGLCALGQKHHDEGIVEYSIHKAGVLGGKYSTNPYKLGFNLLMDIEERWNKGRFGYEYENCTDFKKKENWDLNLGMGKDKVYEVVKLYDDVNLIREFFTQDFCDKYEFFEWKKYPNGEYVIENKDAKKIAKKLMQRHTNRGLPDIRMTDHNHLNRGIMLLEHQWEGRSLYMPYIDATLTSIYQITGKSVLLVTKDQNAEEVIFYSDKDHNGEVVQLSRMQYKREFGLTMG